MPQVTFNFSDRVVNTLARRFGYDPQRDGAKGGFVRARAIAILNDIVESQEREEAEVAARSNATPGDIT